jgi:hypothetical protein
LLLRGIIQRQRERSRVNLTCGQGRKGLR